MTSDAHEPAGSQKEQGVEGLRGFAALCVLYTHFLWPYELDPQFALTEGWKIFECSQAAVLLFFILSGYVIGLTNRRPFNGPNWRDYLWRRVVRLVPLCWIALLLSALVRPTDPGVLFGNLLFLQNGIGYGDWVVPVMKANSNVWTLNYEALYYFLFVLCWLRPFAWKTWLGLAVALSVAGWIFPDNWGPLVSCYAFGWTFWLAGYALSQLKEGSTMAVRSLRLPWISVFLFWIVAWQQKPLWNLCRRFDLLPREHAGAWANYSFFDILPASLVLLLAASGRRPRITGVLCWTAALLPSLYLVWTLLRGRASLLSPDHHLIFCALGWALWWVRPDGVRVWSLLAWVGSISYGLYILQRPVQWFVMDAAWLPSGDVGSFALRLLVALALTFAVAWIAEVKIQPWLRRRLVRSSSPRPAMSVAP